MQDLPEPRSLITPNDEYDSGSAESSVDGICLKPVVCKEHKEDRKISLSHKSPAKDILLGCSSVDKNIHGAVMLKRLN